MTRDRAPARIRRWTTIAGRAALVVLGSGAAIAVVTGERAPVVSVRWIEGLDEAATTQLRRAYGLRTCQVTDGRTATCEIVDTSRANLGRLVADPRIEDSQYIDRTAFTVLDGAPRGRTWAWAAHRIAVLREPGVMGALLAAAIALVLAGAAAQIRAAASRWGPPALAVIRGRARAIGAGLAQWPAVFAAHPWRAGAVLTAAYLIPLSAYAYLARYTRFMADDYCAASQAQPSLLDAVVTRYMATNGRFSAHVLDMVVTSLGPWRTWWTIDVALVAWLVALAAFLSLWLAGDRRGTRTAAAAVGAVVIVASSLFLAPRMAQSFYWGSGMRPLIPGLILAPVVGYLILAPARRAEAPRAWRAIVVALVAFVAGGFSETVTAAYVAVLSAATAAGVARRGRIGAAPALYSGIALTASLLALAAVAVAPGTRSRQRAFTQASSLFEMARIAAESVWGFLGWMTGSPEHLSVLAGLCVLGCLAGVVAGGAGTARRRGAWLHPPLAAAAVLALLFVCFVPAAYALSTAPPARTQLIPTVVLTFGLVCIGRAIGAAAAQRPWRGLHQAAMLTAALSLLSLNVGIISARALEPSLRMRTFSEYWDRTDAVLRAAAQAGTPAIVIPVEEDFANADDVSTDPTFWVNHCVSRYYGIRVTADQ